MNGITFLLVFGYKLQYWTLIKSQWIIVLQFILRGYGYLNQISRDQETVVITKYQLSVLKV